MSLKTSGAAAPVPSAGWRGQLGRTLASVRWPEVLLQQGTPTFGMLFSVGRASEAKLATATLLIAASCCLFAHAFAFNDWAGIQGDLCDPHRRSRAFSSRGVRRRDMGYLSALFLALGLVLLVPLGLAAVAIGLGIVGLSALYSAPGLHFKGVPLLGSAIHFTGGMLHFLLGYALFRQIDARGLEIGGFFALTLVAGHLTHEARDWEGDRANGIMTNAVRFGRRACIVIGCALFAAAYSLLVWLAARGVVPHPIAWVAVLYPLHLYWTLRTLRADLSFASIGALQMRYRALYLVIGASIVAAQLPSLAP
jgi:4-hydroxybenzoate polyprenyltransferase